MTDLILDHALDDHLYNDFIEHLNEIGVPEYDKQENNGRVPTHFNNAYGIWLEKNDPIAFQVGLQEYILENTRGE